MRIVNYKPEYARELADLFHDSVHAIDPAYYSQHEKEAWAPTPPDYRQWKARLDLKQPLVALINEKIVGFIELDNDGHIDCLYTHKDFQRRGVADALYLRLERTALTKEFTRLYVEASLLARPFFKKNGFLFVKENRVMRNGILLTNFTMEKSIVSDL